MKFLEDPMPSTVVSGVHPRRTLLGLVDAAWLDPDLARGIAHIRARGIAARILLPVGGPPMARVLAPSLDALERAYDASKYRRASQAPWAEARSEGGATEVHVQYVPRGADQPKWIPEVLASLDLGADGATTELPMDLEASEGWPEGQPFHAELALDQALWMRPHPALARYRSPIKGLWLCGPGTHPGAGVVGASGYNCVREIRQSR